MLILGRSVKVGDTLKINEEKGYVEKVSLRSTTIVDDYGVRNHVPNSVLTNNEYLEFTEYEVGQSLVTDEKTKFNSLKELLKEIVATKTFGQIVRIDMSDINRLTMYLESGTTVFLGQNHELHEKKLDALEEIISVNPGQPVLVFYNFQADRDALLSRFPNARILDTSQDIEDWNAGRAPMMIAHPASVGHGLNIQEGTAILKGQANARLYRQGQLSKTVIIHHLIAEGTVDEQVMQALKAKDTTQSALMRALKERKDGGQ